jgi:hypothetical protein
MPKGYIYGKQRSLGPGPYRQHAGWRNNRPPDLEATVRRGATWDGTGTKAIAIPRRSYIRAARRMRLPCLIR